MCGRYTLRTPLNEVAAFLDVRDTVELPARYNIAPTQDAAVVRVAKHSAQRELAALHWGLVPSWAKDPAMGGRNINARAETVAAKPSFRNAFRRRRCVVPADGFFEWRHLGGKEKQPHYIRLKSDRPFAFAGLWEFWRKGDQALQSFAIITTDANDLLKPLHDRMPVILPESAIAPWLDCPEDEADSLLPLLRPFPSRDMEHFPVSKHVNSANRDDEKCIERVTAQTTLPGFE